MAVRTALPRSPPARRTVRNGTTMRSTTSSVPDARLDFVVERSRQHLCARDGLQLETGADQRVVDHAESGIGESWRDSTCGRSDRDRPWRRFAGEQTDLPCRAGRARWRSELTLDEIASAASEIKAEVLLGGRRGRRLREHLGRDVNWHGPAWGGGWPASACENPVRPLNDPAELLLYQASPALHADLRFVDRRRAGHLPKKCSKTYEDRRTGEDRNEQLYERDAALAQHDSVVRHHNGLHTDTARLPHDWRDVHRDDL